MTGCIFTLSNLDTFYYYLEKLSTSLEVMFAFVQSFFLSGFLLLFLGECVLNHNCQRRAVRSAKAYKQSSSVLNASMRPIRE